MPGGWVVVFLPGLGGDLGRDGDGLLCDTRSHVVSELAEEVWLMPET